MTDEHSTWEVGLGFTVNRAKRDFGGRNAVLALEGKERFLLAGIVADHGDALAGGETLWRDGEQVGVVNSPVWSHRMNKSLALVHLRPDAANPGRRLEAVPDGFCCVAAVENIPLLRSG